MIIPTPSPKCSQLSALFSDKMFSALPWSMSSPYTHSAEIGDSAGQQVGARCGVGAREHEADHAERQMHDVVQSGHREHPEQLRAGMMAGPLQLVEVARRARDETQHADHQKCGGHQYGGTLHRHDLWTRRHGFVSLRPAN